MSKTYVYAIKFGEFVKIGWTTDPARRLKALQGNRPGVKYMPTGLDLSNPQPIFAVPGDATTEHILHTVCAEQKVTGEWYRYEGVVQAWLERIVRDYTFPFRPPSPPGEPVEF